MKAGVIIPNLYRSRRALTHVGLAELLQGKVAPRSLFERKLGQESVGIALAMAREADELGFDFVSVSEHHAMPLLCEPNAALFGAALSQVVRRAKIAWLGPIVSINNPVRVAEEIAMLDQLTGGDRLVV